MVCESCIGKDKIISELRKEIEELKSQMKEVKEMIFKPARKSGKRKKKAGPKKGHKPCNRPIPDKIHNKVSPELDKCPDCGGPLSEPVRSRKRYVEDIRPPEPFNTEYDIPYYYCKCCKKQFSPKPADAIPKCRLGIKLMLLVVFLRYGMLLPFGKVAKQLEIIYGISVSEGFLVDSMTRFREFAGPEFDKIGNEVRNLSKVHADETGWRVNGKKYWLWDFIGEKHSLLIIDKSRGSRVLRENLGEKKGRIVNCDCYSAYDKFGGRQQKCWSHLLRNSKNLGNDGGIIHLKLRKMYKKAKLHAGKGTAPKIKRELEDRIEKLALIPLEGKKGRAFVKTVTKHKENLFRFMVEGVDATNNAAERGLRQSVVMRKITGGNRSMKGAVNHSVIMSVMGTWEKQGLDFFDQGMEIMKRNLP